MIFASKMTIWAKKWKFCSEFSPQSDTSMPDIKFSLSSKSLSICPSQMYNSKLKKLKILKIMLTDGIRFSNSLIRVFMATSMLVTDVGYEMSW